MILEGATNAKEDLLKQNKKMQNHLKDFQVRQTLPTISFGYYVYKYFQEEE